MAYPYQFVDLDDEQQACRRYLLNSYGQFAQLSILLLPLIYQLAVGISLLIGRIRKSKAYQPVKDHSSPVISRFNKRPNNNLHNTWSKIRWYLNGDLVSGRSTRQVWLSAVLWATWLLVLATKDTGDDYLHLTRRFGIVAASQLPLHYLLALKSWSPVQYLARMSHEELNVYHRFLGRIIIMFMAVHASLYLNFYVQKGLLMNRIRDWDVILGLTAISTAILIGTTALSRVRTWNYRVFFYLHVILSISLLPILYLHVPYLRIYILEATAIYGLLILQRNIEQAPTLATLKHNPITNLLFITIPLPPSFSKLTFAPGQHIYLGFPSLPQKLRVNPFSIANPNPPEDKCIQLFARALNGTTAMLADLERKPQPVLLLIEGPYGSAKYFPDLATYDQVLLVAGGVGATFALPIYRDLLIRNERVEGESIPGVRFVWTVRQAADARWGFDQLRHHSAGEGSSTGLELYVTGSPSQSDGDFELREREVLLRNSPSTAVDEHSGQDVRRGRPDLRNIVDAVFSNDSGESVAVLVCGPQGMGAALRNEVGRWVGKGRDFFWHSEEFGW